MRIALDAMGSDNAPLPEVEGAVAAALAGAASHSTRVEVLLVGETARLESALSGRRLGGAVSIVPASQAITMDDSPAVAVRQKRDSSLMVALRLLKEGKADAVLSAGNTGAVVVAARVILGPIRGVARAAIGQMFPTLQHPVLVLDLGATVDCSARHLCDFAEMGFVYSKDVVGVPNPRVGLLNIGEEQVKGNELAKTVHGNLSATPHINFIGNVEPRALFEGVADVVVCDGFVGNVVLKTSEAVSAGLRTSIMRELSATWMSKLGALLSMGAFRRLKKRVDPNMYGGAPLLGVNGPVFILHGATTSEAVANAIRAAAHAVEVGITDHIREGIGQIRAAERHQNAQERAGGARKEASSG